MASHRPLANSICKASTLRPIALAFVLVSVATLRVDPALADEQSPQNLMADDAPSRGAANVSPEVAQKAAAISRQTMSPFCPGRTLSDCPSPNATEWRKEIRAMVAAGMSAADIQAELEKRAGGSLSGSPNRKTSWSVPIFLTLAAALTLYFVFARLRPRKAVRATKEKSDGETGKTPPSAGVDDARLAQELESEEV